MFPQKSEQREEEEEEEHETCTNLKRPPPLREGPNYINDILPITRESVLRSGALLQ